MVSVHIQILTVVGKLRTKFLFPSITDLETLLDPEVSTTILPVLGAHYVQEAIKQLSRDATVKQLGKRERKKEREKERER